MDHCSEMQSLNIFYTISESRIKLEIINYKYNEVATVINNNDNKN